MKKVETLRVHSLRSVQYFFCQVCSLFFADFFLDELPVLFDCMRFLQFTFCFWSTFSHTNNIVVKVDFNNFQ